MIRTIVDSRFRLDGGAMNGIVPRALWSRPHPPDDQGRIELVMRVTLFEEREAGLLWLVEAGMGDGWSEKETGIYAIERPGGGIAAGLEKLGIAAADVTGLVLTHLHFDHCAGAFTRRGGGLSLTFPDAKIYVQRRQMDWALRPPLKDLGSYRAGDMELLAASPNLVLLDGEARLSDAVSVSPLYGHTDAMQTVTLRSSGETFVVAADLIPMFSHVRIPWVMAYDNFPLTTIEEKKRFLERAAAESWTLISVHDAAHEAARIRKTGELRFEALSANLESTYRTDDPTI
jgi:glyoxylase-like metal-dependent hydrolase (beta-lactamase superfamily II)